MNHATNQTRDAIALKIKVLKQNQTTKSASMDPEAVANLRALIDYYTAILNAMPKPKDTPAIIKIFKRAVAWILE